MMVYILKFDTPISGRAAYYIGYCVDGRLDQRLEEHRLGTGAALTRAARDYGIAFEVVHTFPGASRAFERSLKHRKSTPRIVERIQRGTFRRPEVL
jgi:predicted GIY-YIG superfamily endonuclease